MSTLKSMLTLFLLNFIITISGNSQTWILPKNENGWSLVAPSADSRIIYVSKTDGDDATAQHYLFSDIGNNPRNPEISIKPFRTLSRAIKSLRNGYPDWILIKSGDTFEGVDIKLNTIGSGRAPNERMVMTYYGNTGKRPVLKNCSLISYKNVRNNNWAFIGLNFYDSRSDPGSKDYIASRDGSGTLTFLAGGSHILIEDCVLKFYGLTIQGFDGPFYKIEIRRNILTDQYAKSSCDGARTSSAFISNVHDYLIEENLTDFSGWNEALLPGSGRNMFNHGWYLQYDCSGELFFRGNIMCRSSANAVQNRSGGAVEYNLSIQCPAGIFVAHDTSNGPAAKAGMTCSKNNVVLEGLWMGDCPASSNANWAMPLGNNLEQGTIIEGNIVAHNIDKRGSIQAIQQVSKCSYKNNIVYDWHRGGDMWNANWLAPERSVGSYSETIGLDAKTEAFIDSARNRKVNEWPAELSAYAVIDYVREGFNMDSIGNKITYKTFTAIQEFKNQPGVKKLFVYPNPLDNTATISYTLEKSQPVSVGLYDQTGRKIVHVAEKIQPPGLQTIELNTENSEPGLYILKVETGNGVAKTKKLIIRKN